jgi:hypothetical protein
MKWGAGNAFSLDALPDPVYKWRARLFGARVSSPHPPREVQGGCHFSKPQVLKPGAAT